MSSEPTVSAHQKAPGGLANWLGLGFMRLLARLPLTWIRALGWLLGRALHAVAGRRRRIALTNWALCFPDQPAAEREAAVRRHFVLFAQAWLDRSWLWEAGPEVVRRRLLLKGDLGALEGDRPTVMFAPHFVGMDAGWTAITAHLPRRFCGIYAEQLNPDVDRWMAQGRQRFGDPHIVAMRQGLKPLVSALRDGLPLYLLPDMDYGAADSVFVPFYGVPAATIRRIAAEIAAAAFDEPVIIEQPWTDVHGRRHERMVGRPVAFHAMRGISAHSNGFHTCRALHLLQLLLGAVDTPGSFRYQPPFPRPIPPANRPGKTRQPNGALDAPPHDVRVVDDQHPDRLQACGQSGWHGACSSA